MKKNFLKIALAFALLINSQSLATDKIQKQIEEAKIKAEEYSKRSDLAKKAPPPKLKPAQEKAKEICKLAREKIPDAETAKDMDEIINLYKKAIEIAPDYEEPWWGLGMALWTKTTYFPEETKQQRQFKIAMLEEAKKACAKAQKLNPMSPGANYWMCNIILTEAGLKRSWTNLLIMREVFKLSDKVAEVDPYYEYGAIFRTYAIVLMVMPGFVMKYLGYSPEIILPYLDKAIEREPNCFANYNVRAGIYQRLGEKEKALKDLEYVIKGNPELLRGYEKDNRLRQKEARSAWKNITGKEFDEK